MGFFFFCVVEVQILHFYFYYLFADAFLLFLDYLGRRGKVRAFNKIRIEFVIFFTFSFTWILYCYSPHPVGQRSPQTGLYPTIFSQTSIPKKEDLFIRVLRVHKRVVSPTVVGAGCRVFGAGLADDVLMDLVPFILIVTPGEQQKTIMSYKG